MPLYAPAIRHYALALFWSCSCLPNQTGHRFPGTIHGHESFKATCCPKQKLPTIPTLVTPTGEVIRDGAAIIEHFEAKPGDLVGRLGHANGYSARCLMSSEQMVSCDPAHALSVELQRR